MNGFSGYSGMKSTHCTTIFLYTTKVINLMKKPTKLITALLLAMAVNSSYAEEKCFSLEGEIPTLAEVLECFQKQADEIKAENKALRDEIQALKLRLSLSDGLVAYYPFDGDANDVSGHGNHGSVKGATLTADMFGNMNRAYHFDGNDDYIQFNTPVIHYTAPYSVSFWIKYGAVPDVNNYLVSNGGQTNSSQGFAFAVVGSSHTYCNQSYPKGAIFFIVGYQESAVRTTVFAPISLGEWHHVTGIWDGHRVILYIDGQLAQTDVCENPYQFGSPQNMRIGAPSNILNYYFSGQLDALRIYNRTLTALEIQALYKQPQVFLNQEE